MDTAYVTVSLLLLTSRIYEGTAVLTTASFFTVGSDNTPVPADPGLVTLIYTPGPEQTPVTWVWNGAGKIFQGAPGVYEAFLETGGYPGRWEVVWTGTDPVVAKGQAGFLVSPLPL